jgi:CBS domain-containing protein
MDMPEKTVTPEDTLAVVLEAFDEHDQEALPIVSADGKALGIAERPALDHYIHERILQAHIASEQLGNAP